MHLNTPAVTKRCYCGLVKRRPCTHHQQFPVWNLGLGKGLNQQTQQVGTADWNSNQMGNYWQNHQQFPTWNLGTELRAGVFQSNRELWSNYQKVPTWNCRKTIRLEAQGKESGAQNQEELTHGPRKWWERELKGFAGYNACVSCRPWSHQKSASVPLLPPNQRTRWR